RLEDGRSALRLPGALTKRSLTRGFAVQVGAELVVEGSEPFDDRGCGREVSGTEFGECRAPAFLEVCTPLRDQLASVCGERAGHDAAVAFGAGALDEVHLGEAVEQLGDGRGGE